MEWCVWGGGRGDATVKGSHERIPSYSRPSSVSWLWWWLHESIPVIKWYRRPPPTSTCKERRKVNKLSYSSGLHCTYRCQFPVLTMSCDYVRCQHGGRWVRGTQDFSILFQQLPVSLRSFQNKNKFSSMVETQMTYFTSARCQKMFALNSCYRVWKGGRDLCFMKAWPSSDQCMANIE